MLQRSTVFRPKLEGSEGARTGFRTGARRPRASLRQLPWSGKLLLCAAAFFATTSLAAGSSAQQPAREDFGERVDVYVVNVDVHVSDRDGRPVGGLGAEDFEIYIDGQRVRELAYFYAGEVPQGPASSADQGAAAPAEGVAEGVLDGSGKSAPAAADPDPTAAAAAGSDVGSEAQSAPAPAPIPVPAGGELARMVVLVDNFNTSPPRRNRVLQRLRDYLEEATPRPEVMFATYDGAINILQPFSNDPITQRATLETIAGMQSRSFERDAQRTTILTSVSNAVTALSESSTGLGGGGADFARSEINSAVRQVEIYAESSYRESLTVVRTLGVFIQSLAGVDGRKSVVFVSEGLPMRPGSGLADLLQDATRDGADVFEGFQGNDGGGFGGQGPDGQATFPGLGGGGAGGGGDRDPLQQEIFSLRSTLAQYDIGRFLSELTSLANTHRVTFYTINGAAGAPAVLGADVGSGLGFETPVGNALSLEQQNQQESLRYMAETTGGVALTSGTAVDQILEQVEEDGSAYYALGITPPDGVDDEYHRIEVRLAERRRGVDLRHREGFVAARRPAGRAATAVSLLTLGMEDNPLGIGLEVLGEEPAPDAGQHVLQLQLAIPIGSLVLAPQGDGSYRADLRVLFASMDQSGSIGPVRSLPLSFAVPAERLEEARQQEYQARLPLPLEDGPRRLAVGVEDQLGGRIAFVLEDLLVGGSSADEASAADSADSDASGEGTES